MERLFLAHAKLIKRNVYCHYSDCILAASALLVILVTVYNMIFLIGIDINIILKFYSNGVIYL